MRHSRAMNLWLGTLTLVLALLSGCATGGVYRESNAASPAPYADYSIDELDSYGEWFVLPPYGQVWKANVSPEWRPFYFGHWDYTPPNWTWISYEPFGWIVYHYGNWIYSGTYGWVWIPGNGPWSPATVEWMSYDDFVCWAPLPPRGVILPHPWERDQQGIDEWNVVHARDFASDNIGEHRVESFSARPRDERGVFNSHFPDPRMIEQHSGHPVQGINIPREPVKVGKQQLHKMKIPPSDQQRADKYKPQVDKHVTRNAGNQRSTGNHR